MLQIKALTITHRKDLRTIVRDLNLTIGRGDRAVLIGEEGNGKSTLLKWMYDPALVEDYAEAEGERTVQGDILGYLPQELPEADRNKSAAEYFGSLPAFSEADPVQKSRLASQLGFSEGLYASEQTLGSLSGGERVKARWRGCFSHVRTSCFWTSPPTTSTWRPSHGWRS